MATTIEWVARPGTTPETWNPVTGCNRNGRRIKASPGCDHCWAERMARRLAGRFGYPEAPNHFDVTLRPDRLDAPLRWRKPRTVFVTSMGDLFHEDVSDEFIGDIWWTITEAKSHTFLILTKRIERASDWFKEFWPLSNIWLGVTVENQLAADERVPLLLRTPAAVRFVSCEPLLESVNLESIPLVANDRPDFKSLNALTRKVAVAGYEKDMILGRYSRIDWVIVGGESGSSARPMHPDWARSLRDQCQTAGVPFFFKQWGEWLPFRQVLTDEQMEAWSKLGETHQWEENRVSMRIGKRRAGRLLDGREWNEWPK